jgi:hypothetical protein
LIRLLRSEAEPDFTSVGSGLVFETSKRPIGSERFPDLVAVGRGPDEREVRYSKASAGEHRASLEVGPGRTTIQPGLVSTSTPGCSGVDIDSTTLLWESRRAGGTSGNRLVDQQGVDSFGKPLRVGTPIGSHRPASSSRKKPFLRRQLWSGTGVLTFVFLRKNGERQVEAGTGIPLRQMVGSSESFTYLSRRKAS